MLTLQVMDPVELAEQIGDTLQQYGINVEEVACSTAMFVLSVKDGTEITQKVVKWFHPDGGERFFRFLSPGDVEEYFTIVVFENQPSVHTLSFGILRKGDRCHDIWSFQSSFPDQKRFVESSAGYIVEIAWIDQEKDVHLDDFTEAKHIQTKYLQRLKNQTHYYPRRSGICGNDFLVVKQIQPDLGEWVYEKAQEALHNKVHAWDLTVSDEDLTSGFRSYMCGNKSVRLTSTKTLESVVTTPQTNVWGCLLYDIAAQSLTSASIPKTRLFIPWVLTRESKQALTLKMVV